MTVDSASSTSIDGWVALLCLLIMAIGFVVAARHPKYFVRGWGRFYRARYKGMSNIEMDEKFQTPWDRLTMGERSQFIRYAPEEPERFPGLILLVQCFCWIAAGFCLFALSFALFLLLLQWIQ